MTNVLEQAAGLPSSGKCGHGVYIAKGDTFAHYCSACNPGAFKIMSKSKRVVVVKNSERTLDTAEYFDQPLSERLSFAATMEDMTL